MPSEVCRAMTPSSRLSVDPPFKADRHPSRTKMSRTNGIQAKPHAYVEHHPDRATHQCRMASMPSHTSTPHGIHLEPHVYAERHPCQAIHICRTASMPNHTSTPNDIHAELHGRIKFASRSVSCEATRHALSKYPILTVKN